MRLFLLLVVEQFLYFQLPLSAHIKVTKTNLYRNYWNTHKLYYNLTISESEEEERLSIFVSNIKRIQELNARNNGVTYKMNHFGHLTGEEFLKYVAIGNNKYRWNVSSSPKYKPSEKVFGDIDWREKGIDDKVYNQGNCGSCWAFSTTGQLESQYALKKLKKVKLSEQDLIDCSKSFGNEGCNGGLMNYSFDYVRAQGINSNKDYPYTEKEGKCSHNVSNSVMRVKEFFQLNPGDENQLAETVSSVGPVSVAMAVVFDFQFYFSGVYSSTSCKEEELNHAVLIVGLGSQPSKHYIIKNSWGQFWGMNGYFLIARDNQNMCGISSAGTYAIIED